MYSINKQKKNAPLWASIGPLLYRILYGDNVRPQQINVARSKSKNMQNFLIMVIMYYVIKPAVK